VNAPEKKILIVEDDRTTALIEKLYLEELGYQITKIVANGEQAIEMTGKLKPDLVLMDIKLGKGMDGIDAAEVINKEFGIPVVLVTAYTDEALLERVMLTKFAGYINKPIREKDLLATIEIALSKIKNLPEQQQKKTDIRNARMLIFFRGLGSYIEKKYGTPLHDVIANTACVLFDDPTIDTDRVRFATNPIRGKTIGWLTNLSWMT